MNNKGPNSMARNKMTRNRIARNKTVRSKNPKSTPNSKPTPLWAILTVILCTFFTATGQYCIKMGLKNVTSILGLINSYMIVGLSLYFVGAILLIIALSKGSLSVLYPIISLGFIWVSLLGIYFLSESLSVLNWLGIACIIIGITFIGFSER